MVETTVVLNNAFELKGKKYVFVHRKGMDCFVAITDIKMVHPYYKEIILYKCNSINTDNEKFAALHEAMITLKK